MGVGGGVIAALNTNVGYLGGDFLESWFIVVEGPQKREGWSLPGLALHGGPAS